MERAYRICLERDDCDQIRWDEEAALSDLEVNSGFACSETQERESDHEQHYHDSRDHRMRFGRQEKHDLRHRTGWENPGTNGSHHEQVAHGEVLHETACACGDRSGSAVAMGERTARTTRSRS